MESVKLTHPKGVKKWLQVYRLYQQAFPAAEKKPFSMVLRMFRKGKTDIWCIEKEGRFAGIAITINSPRLVLLDYFAVKRKLRSRGIGRAALEKLFGQIYADRGFFLEIESTAEPAPNRQQRQKRKQFYLSCGLRELGVTAGLFGVNMELLGLRCSLDFDRYKAFYRNNYNQWAADHITPPQ